jgi:hypothetical protein
MWDFFKIDWESIIVLGVKTLKGKRVESCNMQGCFGAVVYHIRTQRNHIIFGGQVRSKENILKIMISYHGI